MMQRTTFSGSGKDKDYSRIELSKMNIKSLITICRIKGIPEEIINHRPPTPPRGRGFKSYRRPNNNYKRYLIKIILNYQNK